MNTLASCPPLCYGLPAGLCLTGLATLIWPASPAWMLCTVWAVVYILLALSCRSLRWCSAGCAWVLWAASVVLWTGISINSNYYINVIGHGDPSAPVLMNFDAWSAWNNALFDNGRADAMFSHWPALDYGHLIGALVWLFGPDFSIALMFNATCALATILLSGAIAVSCTGGDTAAQRRMAFTTMLFTAAMCYFLASGTVLIKDCPLALAIAMTTLGALRLRKGPSPAAIATIIIAAAGIYYMRKNYMVVPVGILLLTANRRHLLMPVVLAAGLLAVWLLIQYRQQATPIAHYSDLGGAFTTTTRENYGHDDDYNNGITAYLSKPLWLRVLMLPIVTAVQMLIPLPWSWDKYLIFGPFMALAHFSFCRYLLSGLVLYFVGRQFRSRAPRLLLTITGIGLLLYVASAFSFGGTVARYGIPLIGLLTPCGAYAWLHYRHERAFRIWAIVYIAGMAAALTLAYFATT